MVSKTGNVVRVSVGIDLTNNAQARLYGGAVARIADGFRPAINPEAGGYTEQNNVTGRACVLAVYNAGSVTNRYLDAIQYIFFTIDPDGYIRIPPTNISNTTIYFDATFLTGTPY